MEANWRTRARRVCISCRGCQRPPPNLGAISYHRGCVSAPLAKASVEPRHWDTTATRCDSRTPAARRPIPGTWSPRGRGTFTALLDAAMGADHANSAWAQRKRRDVHVDLATGGSTMRRGKRRTAAPHAWPRSCSSCENDVTPTIHAHRPLVPRSLGAPASLRADPVGRTGRRNWRRWNVDVVRRRRAAEVRRRRLGAGCRAGREWWRGHHGHRAWWRWWWCGQRLVRALGGVAGLRRPRGHGGLRRGLAAVNPMGAPGRCRTERTGHNQRLRRAVSR